MRAGAAALDQRRRARVTRPVAAAVVERRDRAGQRGQPVAARPAPAGALAGQVGDEPLGPGDRAVLDGQHQPGAQRAAGLAQPRHRRSTARRAARAGRPGAVEAAEQHRRVTVGQDAPPAASRTRPRGPPPGSPGSRTVSRVVPGSSSVPSPSGRTGVQEVTHVRPGLGVREQGGPATGAPRPPRASRRSPGGWAGRPSARARPAPARRRTAATPRAAPAGPAGRARSAIAASIAATGERPVAGQDDVDLPGTERPRGGDRAVQDEVRTCASQRAVLAAGRLALAEVDHDDRAARLRRCRRAAWWRTGTPPRRGRAARRRRRTSARSSEARARPARRTPCGGRRATGPSADAGEQGRTLVGPPGPRRPRPATVLIDASPRARRALSPDQPDHARRRRPARREAADRRALPARRAAGRCRCRARAPTATAQATYASRCSSRQVRCRIRARSSEVTTTSTSRSRASVPSPSQSGRYVAPTQGTTACHQRMST